MAKDKIAVGLDIGSSIVKMAVGIRKPNEEKPQIIALASAPSSGVRKGTVVEIKEVVQGIAKVLDMIQKTSGVSIGSAVVSVNGNHLNAKKTKGVVAVSRADSEISDGDITRVLEAAKTISLPQNREIIKTIPCSYSVDNETGIKDPIGMNGVRLEVSAMLIDALSPNLKNLIKCVNDAGLEIEEFVPAGLASASSILNQKQLELGTAIVDIGSGTTNLAVFEEGELIHFKVLPLGGMYITNDITIGLRTSSEVAEEVKIRYGNVLPSHVGKKEVINMSEFGPDLNFKVSAVQLTEIIEARVSEIFDLINKELKNIDRKGLLPGGIVFVGGGSKIPGTIELAKEHFKLPAQIGAPSNVGGVLDEIVDPIFATCLGLINEGFTNEEPFEGRKRSFALKGLGKVREMSFKKFFKSFLP